MPFGSVPWRSWPSSTRDVCERTPDADVKVVVVGAGVACLAAEAGRLVADAAIVTVPTPQAVSFEGRIDLSEQLT